MSEVTRLGKPRGPKFPWEAVDGDAPGCWTMAPRKWLAVVDGHGDTVLVSEIDPVNMEEMLRRVNAFAALLAVAKAAEWPETRESEAFCSICRTMAEPHESECLYAKLDTAHPGWREWA